MPLANERTTQWWPLVSGKRADAVWAVIDEILDQLARTPLHGPGLAGGHAGIALVYAYVGLCRRGTRASAWTLARHHLDEAERGVDVLDPSLFTGASGIGWVSNHLDRRLSGASVEQDSLNHHLAIASRSPLRGGLDLTGGATGLLLYAQAQAETKSARTLLEGLIDGVCLAQQQLGDGCWTTPASALEDIVRRDYPDGILNLGLAHGVPGALSVLSLGVWISA
jgi:hypothetical protein